MGINIVRLPQDGRRLLQIALIRRPDRGFAHIAAADGDNHQRGHRAKAKDQTPEPVAVAFRQHGVKEEHQKIRDADGRVPGGAPHCDAGGFIPRAFQPGELAEKRHRDGKVDPNAKTHHKARARKHIFVRGQRTGDSGNDKEHHVGHKDAVAPDFIRKIAAEQRPDNRAKGNRRGHHAGTGGRQVKFAGDVFDAECQRAEIVGIEKNSPERDTDHDAGIGPALRAVINET